MMFQILSKITREKFEKLIVLRTRPLSIPCLLSPVLVIPSTIKEDLTGTRNAKLVLLYVHLYSSISYLDTRIFVHSRPQQSQPISSNSAHVFPPLSGP